MPLTPIDIQQKTFGPELRGYNMDEVDDFLDEVVTTLKDYDQRVRDAQDRIRALEAEVTTRGQDETAISRALVAAQKQADAVLEEAHQEAERIRSDAHDEADHLRAERDAERLALTQDIAHMRATVADLKRRILELANSASENLDVMDSAIAAASETVSGTGDSNGPAFDSLGEDASSSPDVDDEAEIWQVPGGGYPEPGEDEERREPEPSEPSEPEPSESEPSEPEPSESEPSEREPSERETSEPEPALEADPSEEVAPAEQGSGEEHQEYEEEERGVGGLADEMADEAAGSPSGADQDSSAPPSRRPWERGSV